MRAHSVVMPTAAAEEITDLLLTLIELLHQVLQYKEGRLERAVKVEHVKGELFARCASLISISIDRGINHVHSTATAQSSLAVDHHTSLIHSIVIPIIPILAD